MVDQVKENLMVKLHYKGTLDNGEVFDSSEGREPLEVMAGVGALIPGFDNALIGMKVGEKKTIHVPVDEAYGKSNDQLIQEVPKEHLKGSGEMKEGEVIALRHPQSPQPFHATVKKIGDTTVTLDFNPPLAGKDLNFDLEILEVREATPEETEMFTPHCCSCDESGCGSDAPSCDGTGSCGTGSCCDSTHHEH